jgi:Concanavalin A-like lectin/glucanases superfamily
VTMPALGLSSSNVTFTAWIYPNTTIVNGTGLIYTRASTYTAGMQYYNGIGYTWNHASAPTYDWASGLVPANNAWSFVAVVLNGTKAVAYLLGTDGILHSATNPLTNDVETWNGVGALGADPANVPSRVFNGTLNDLAVFNYALSPAQINQLVSNASTGLALTIQQSDSNIVLTWTGTLVESTTLNGPWTTVPDAVSPYVVVPTGGQMFYRVKTQSP